MLRDTCISMLNNIQEYKHSPKELLLYYMNKRLNKSLETYYTELSESIEYLSRRKDPTKIVRKMTK